VPGGAHVPLDRPIADPDAQLQELAADALGAPQPVLRRQPLDQRDRLGGHLRSFRPGRGPGAPHEAEALPMPAQQRVWLHDEEHRAPTADEARQEDEAAAIYGGEHGPPYLAAKDDELLAEEGILGDEFGFRPGQIGQRPAARRARRRSEQRQETSSSPSQKRPGASPE